MKFIEIQTEKRYKGKDWINRFMHLLNLQTNNSYELDKLNMMCSIRCKNTGLIIANFSDNPFKF